MNNTTVREIRGAKINPKSSFKNQGAQNTRGVQITRANTVLVFPLQKWVHERVSMLRYTYIAGLICIQDPQSLGTQYQSILQIDKPQTHIPLTTSIK